MPTASRLAPTASPPSWPSASSPTPAADIKDPGGVGGTLAGNALSVAAMRATLGEVLTDEVFDGMIAVATRFTVGLRSVLDRRRLPWTIARLGARARVSVLPRPAAHRPVASRRRHRA